MINLKYLVAALVLLSLASSGDFGDPYRNREYRRKSAVERVGEILENLTDSQTWWDNSVIAGQWIMANRNLEDDERSLLRALAETQPLIGVINVEQFDVCLDQRLNPALELSKLFLDNLGDRDPWYNPERNNRLESIVVAMQEKISAGCMNEYIRRTTWSSHSDNSVMWMIASSLQGNQLRHPRTHINRYRVDDWYILSVAANVHKDDWFSDTILRAAAQNVPLEHANSISLHDYFYEHYKQLCRRYNYGADRRLTHVKRAAALARVMRVNDRDISSQWLRDQVKTFIHEAVTGTMCQSLGNINQEEFQWELSSYTRRGIGH